MARPAPLPADVLYRACDPAQFDFDSTAELEDLEQVIGQQRAVDAIAFGIGIRHQGYNLFVLGPPGTGKHSVVRQYLERVSADRPRPDDWCYVRDFKDANRPRALQLPAGRGAAFQHQMEELIDELGAAIPAAFESDDYRNRRQALEQEFKDKHQQDFEDIQQRAKEKDIAPVNTPNGMALAPVRDGEVLPPEEFRKLPEEEQERIKRDIEELEKEVRDIAGRLPAWEKEQREKVRELNREVVSFAVDKLLAELKQAYADLEPVTTYLEALAADVVDRAEDFLPSKEQKQQPAAPPGVALPPGMQKSDPLDRYRVNLLVDNAETEGAPVIYEDHPSLQNLLGRVEHRTEFGALVTDHRLIRAGALHRANGGTLILDANKLLTQPLAWDNLKRTLRAGQVRIESVGQQLSLISTITLEPEAIPLEAKVVLVGERMIYYLLSQLDPDFPDLFKVQVDFDDRMPRKPENDQLYARLVATLARRHQLLPFTPEAVARIIERSSRLVADAERLSIRMGDLVDLLCEADHWAAQAERDTVTDDDVERAVAAQIHRADRVRERSQEQIARGTVRIATSGERIGQINGLSVLQLGGFAFGQPNRITARVRLGKGEVTDIEREVALGGPLHSKGVLILAGFLGARFAGDRPFALSASLVFEQSYGGVDGDSASSAELYALLSALADTPLRQGLAVTGSVDQHGRIQAIGGVNEKIEGFFDVCRAAGLSGDQGVLIPASNTIHLMLRRDVRQAVAAGRFSIIPVGTIDQGIELLTGVAAGDRQAGGGWPADSINARVQRRLDQMADRARRYAAAAREAEPSP